MHGRWVDINISALLACANKRNSTEFIYVIFMVLGIDIKHHPFLPQHLRDMIHISGSQRASDETASRCNNNNIFKSKLKTFLFTQAYDVP